jgi:alanine racemase
MDSSSTLQQLKKFDQVREEFGKKGIAFEWNHAANSAAVLRWPQSWYDGVRPGLILYGINPFPDGTEPLKPLLSWKTRIMQLRRIKKGTGVGYGSSFVARRDSVLATLPVGYADGYNRQLSNRGSVLLHGRRVPLAGRVSMDLTVIDVTDASSAQVGDEVVLLGRQGDEEITASELANLSQTISYEILTSISRRVPRRYLKDLRPLRVSTGERAVADK